LKILPGGLAAYGGAEEAENQRSKYDEDGKGAQARGRPETAAGRGASMVLSYFHDRRNYQNYRFLRSASRFSMDSRMSASSERMALIAGSSAPTWETPFSTSSV
jgi:hypothetical protein